MEEVPKAADAFKAVCDALPLLIAHKKKAEEEAAAAAAVAASNIM